MKKIILFELNEVPWRIVKYFIRARPNSSLARIFPRARKFETFAEDQGHLSPWVTWPSMHRGVPNTAHYIQEFGQPLSEVDSAFPPIWQILARERIKVGVFGSLHSFPPPKSYENYGFYVPDVFASGSECFPKSLEAFQAFNLRMSRESARNVSESIPLRSALPLLSNLSELGFRARTIGDVTRQLIEEKVDRWKIIRRRTYQTVLGFDVFYKQLVRTRPDFTTFFTNHVASSLHRYWAAAFPEDYESLGYDLEWLNTFNQEILFTMEKADRMVGRLVLFAEENPEFQLIVATSMGQQATLAQPIETQLYIVNLSEFMSALGLDSSDWTVRPAMLPQVNVQVHGPNAARFEDQLQNLKVNGKPIDYVRKTEGFFSITLGQANLSDVNLSLGSRAVASDTLGIENVEIKDKSGTTAYHIPHGTLLMYDASMKPTENMTQVSTLDLAPYLLRNYGLKTPEYMRGSANLL